MLFCSKSNNPLSLASAFLSCLPSLDHLSTNLTYTGLHIHRDSCCEVSRSRTGARDGTTGSTFWLVVRNHFFTDKLLPCLGWRQHCWGPRARPTQWWGQVAGTTERRLGPWSRCTCLGGRRETGKEIPSLSFSPGETNVRPLIGQSCQGAGKQGSLGNVVPFEPADQRKDSLDRQADDRHRSDVDTPSLLIFTSN